jgi:hypothetical protein
VRHWLQRGVAPDSGPRRKRQSDFDPYAPYILMRWEEGERNGTPLWQEIAAQGYPGSQRMVYRFLKTLKTQEIEAAAGVQCLPHFSSTAAVSLFMRHPDKLEEIEREHLIAFRRADLSLDTTYQLIQDFLLMMRKREGERLDAWLSQVHESHLPIFLLVHFCIPPSLRMSLSPNLCQSRRRKSLPRLPVSLKQASGFTKVDTGGEVKIRAHSEFGCAESQA